MADNYLEKQYEQYEARKAAWEKERKLGKRPKRHTPPHGNSLAQEMNRIEEDEADGVMIDNNGFNDNDED